MDISRELHEWEVSYAEARQIQCELKNRVRFMPLPEPVEFVAGADMAFSREEGLFFATVVIMTYPDMEIVETRSVRREADFPYIPGLLSFREGPAVLRAFSKVKTRPDVVIFDGQGIAHPRRLGLAAHVGLWLDIPSIGCAKSRLIGENESPGSEKGAHVPLIEDGERIGTVLRTRTDVKPVFVSPGHLCNQRDAWEMVLECAIRYKMPEPTRQAHLAVGRAKRKYLEQQE
ncbi:MAG: deoxyribonuclease V [Planctomycetota bacterium]